MTLLDTMLGDPAERHIVVALSMLAALIAMAAVAWWRSRRAAVRRPLAVEDRAWTYCPVCGWARPTDGSATPPKPLDRPTRDAITSQVPAVLNANPLPSDLLRRGWTRSAALDKEGRIVLPCDPQAVAWSLWGAANAALEPGGKAWGDWFRHLTDILAERHGGMSVHRWNRDAGRTHGEVLAVSVDIERRMGLCPRPA